MCSLAAYSLAKHCARVNRQNACQSSWDNMLPPEYEDGPDDDEYEEIIDCEEGYDGILGEG